jgi:hypothetical protein
MQANLGTNGFNIEGPALPLTVNKIPQVFKGLRFGAEVSAGSQVTLVGN